MKEDDYEFIDDNSRALLQEPHKFSGLILKVIVYFLLFAFVWAYFAPLEERTSAVGRVIPSSQVQDIQNLEGGLLSEIFVQEGDIVEKGQVLLRMDDTRFSSILQESQVKYYALLARLARLDAETEGKEVVQFPDIVKNKYPEIIEDERKLFISNQANQHASLSTLKRSYQIGNEQLELTRPLADEGIVSKIELLRLKKEVNEALGKIDIQKQTYQSKVNEQITLVKAELDSLHKSLRGLEDRMQRTVIKSPVYGIVKEINIDTIGGVIKPGEDIMEIVPLEDVLLIEAKIHPQKIAFIRPGQPTDIKISAYDSSIYGSLKGKVKYISADSIIEKNQFGSQDSYFKIVIETDQSYLEYRGEKLPIIPGMQVTADIITGKKTVLEYLLKPIIKAKQKALTEK